MKRRIVKVGDRRYRVELPGGDTSEFSYREKARRWDPDQCCYVDFESGEDRYILSWEGLFMDSFICEEDALLFVIKFGYSINDKNLVPSEILADFNLVYEGGDWVDEWGCPDEHEVMFSMGKIQPPAIRNIRFEGYPRITPKIRPKVHYYDDDGWGDAVVVAEIEIPKLDFEELEKPKQRRRACASNWSDHSDPGYESWMRHRLDVARKTRRRAPADAECVFTLKIGKDAEKAHQVRKKGLISLQK